MQIEFQNQVKLEAAFVDWLITDDAHLVVRMENMAVLVQYGLPCDGAYRNRDGSRMDAETMPFLYTAMFPVTVFPSDDGI